MRFYYVSIRDGNKTGLLAGPYSNHWQALQKVKLATDKAYTVNQGQAAFAAFGTCSIEKNIKTIFGRI